MILAVEDVYLGTEAPNARTEKCGGTTALYVKGDGAPRKVILIIGNGVALNEMSNASNA